MGVINLTPDSFSDGGQSDSPEKFENRIRRFFEQGIDIPDVGAQSTAPTSRPITAQEEWQRLEQLFLPQFERHWPWQSLSLDTFRVENAQKIYAIFKRKHLNGPFIFNDISGCLDQSLINLLLNSDEDFYYVANATFVKKREDSGEHQLFVRPELSGPALAYEVEHFFERACELFHKHGLTKRLILDPGFGFSKTRDQNLHMLNHPQSFLNFMNSQIPVLWGISRKSFLRPQGKSLKDHPELLPAIELEHQRLSFQLFKTFAHRKFLWRLHDPQLAHGFLPESKVEGL